MLYVYACANEHAPQFNIFIVVVLNFSLNEEWNETQKKNSKVSLYVLVTINSRGQVFLTVEDICLNQYIDHSDSNRVSKLWVLAYCRGMTSIQVGKKKVW